MSDLNSIKKLYKEYSGREAETVAELPSSGSNRRYFRIGGPAGSLIAVEGTCVEENKAFIAISRHFRSKGLNVPQVFAVSEDSMIYLQEDLGDMMLFNYLAPARERGKYTEEEKGVLLKAISYLPDLQFRGGEGLDYSVCYPQQEFDRRMISFDQNYFKYCFLKATGLEFSEIRLDEDFRRMADVLMRSMDDTFLYRDFQARNVMLVEGEPWFIDFQGGRKGPVYYDVASFLWQARARYPEALRE
ncbi:MAG: phosphotransferase, partial [Bacteroidales bacterium]|nr:phosphotransferase [Bacteroidales bacterium]